jgi:ribosomal protein S18 acetylase RimI-like enzyme
MTSNCGIVMMPIKAYLRIIRMNYTITLEENPQIADIQTIRQHLVTFNQIHTGIDDYKPLVLTLRLTPLALSFAYRNLQIMGGLVGETYLGWGYIELLWISEEICRLGYGSNLLKQAEAEFEKRGCLSIYLDTFSFQALPFYQKHGYRIFGELENFSVGHSRYFLTKLVAEDYE